MEGGKDNNLLHFLLEFSVLHFKCAQGKLQLLILINLL